MSAGSSSASVADGEVAYFAYGSNMAPSRLRALGVAFGRRVAARLDGWELVFAKIASDADGVAYATIRPAAGGYVEGILYTVTADGLARLDDFEDVPRLYRREQVVVATAESGAQAAAVYVAQDAHVRQGLLPEDWYLGYLLAGADLLSPAWQARLRRQPVVRTARRW